MHVSFSLNTWWTLECELHYSSTFKPLLAAVCHMIGRWCVGFSVEGGNSEPLVANTHGSWGKGALIVQGVWAEL